MFQKSNQRVESGWVGGPQQPLKSWHHIALQSMSIWPNAMGTNQFLHQKRSKPQHNFFCKPLQSLISFMNLTIGGDTFGFGNIFFLRSTTSIWLCKSHLPFLARSLILPNTQRKPFRKSYKILCFCSGRLLVWWWRRVWTSERRATSWRFVSFKNIFIMIENNNNK